MSCSELVFKFRFANSSKRSTTGTRRPPTSSGRMGKTGDVFKRFRLGRTVVESAHTVDPQVPVAAQSSRDQISCWPGCTSGRYKRLDCWLEGKPGFTAIASS